MAVLVSARSYNSRSEVAFKVDTILAEGIALSVVIRIICIVNDSRPNVGRMSMNEFVVPSVHDNSS